MAKAVLTNLNLNQNEIQNAVIQPLAAAPANGRLGQIYYNSTDNFLYRYNGTAWGPVGVVYSQSGSTGAVIVGLNAQGTVTTKNVIELTLDGLTPISGGYVTEGMSMGDAIKALDEAVKNAVAGGGEVNQEAWSYIKVGSDTISASAKKDTFTVAAGSNISVSADTTNKTVTIGATIPSEYITESELTTELGEYVAKAGSTMSGALNMGSNKITNVANGTNNNDAVNKSQLDAAIAGIGAVSFATGSISTSQTSATVIYTGTLINAFVKNSSGEQVITDVTVNASSVVFSVSEAPSAALTCVVVYVGN